MYGYIYITTNLTNGRKYIGKKKSDKFLKNNYLGSGLILKEAINKYGIENFNVELLETCNSLDELNEKEKYWIKYYNAVESDSFYNIASGGDGGILWKEGEHPSLGKDRSGINNPFYGKHHTDEYKKKSSEIHRGQKSAIKGKHRIRKEDEIRYVNYEELGYYITDGWKCSFLENENKKLKGNHAGMRGKHQSEYQKKRASEVHKNKIVSQEVKDKIRNGIANMSIEAKEQRAINQSKAQKNLCWVVNKDNDAKRIHLNELDHYLSMGFIRGRKIKSK